VIPIKTFDVGLGNSPGFKQHDVPFIQNLTPLEQDIAVLICYLARDNHPNLKVIYT
jgi:hypothetical protein